MTNPLNEKDYVTFARRFVKETVETLDYQELKNLVTDYIHEDLQRSYDDYGQVSVFETMDIKELQSLVTDYIHEDLQKSYDDIGQIAAFENMSSWNCDVFDEIAEEYDLEIEEEDF